MKRFLTGLMMIGLIAGPVATARAEQTDRTKVQRTVVGSYRAYPAPVTGCNSALGAWACMSVRTRSTERFVTVKVTDAHGLPVYFTVFGGGVVRGFCGETKRPVPISARYLEIEVGVSRWVAQTACPLSSVKTTGTITVTLSNLP